MTIRTPALVCIGALALCVASEASAQALRDYQCTIERVAIAQHPPGTSLELQEKNYLNREFTVERKSGLMAGALKNSYLTKPQVIDLGSKNNSYKVVNTLRKEQGVGYGSNVYTLVINEFEKQERKSFVFLENDYVYFGHCIHF